MRADIRVLNSIFTSVIILASAVLPIPLPAAELSTAEELFIKAVNEEKGFHDAAVEFARMLDDPSADPGVLFYNIGNSLYLDHDLTAALAAYSGALKFRPGNPDYLANRDLILSELELPVPVPSGTDYIFHAPVMLLGLAGSRLLILLMLCFSCLTALIYTAVRNEAFRSGSLIVLITALVLSVSVFTWDNRSSERAVVKTEESVLHQGDSPLYEELAVLSQGTELRILEERAGWYRVRTLKTESDQSVQGWIYSGNVLKTSDLVDSLR